jgi:preprotein translocase subunit SecE
MPLYAKDALMASTKTTPRRSTSRGQEQRSGLGRLQSTVRDTISEIKKVTWPDRETTRNLTLVVIVMAVLLGALLGGIDAIFVRVWENMPTL